VSKQKYTATGSSFAVFEENVLANVELAVVLAASLLFHCVVEKLLTIIGHSLDK
jgi:hypothetical protein